MCKKNHSKLRAQSTNKYVPTMLCTLHILQNTDTHSDERLLPPPKSTEREREHVWVVEEGKVMRVCG